MSQVILGRLLPNLNISVENEADGSLEDGELSDDQDLLEKPSSNVEPPKKNVDIVRSWMQTLHTPKVYENKTGGFITGLDLSSEVLGKKLEDRAERFGIQKKEETPITQTEINALYKSLEIDPSNLSSCKLKNIRLDALHMRGVDEMSTNEIFKYFGMYGPASVEWINDYSCNVVWLDEATTARAMLGKSQPMAIKKKPVSLDPLGNALPVQDTPKSSSQENIEYIRTNVEMSDSEEEDDDDNRRFRDARMKSETPMEVDMDEVVDTSDVNIPVPPGHWRLGDPHPKAKALLLRFATKDDKKVRGAEKRSQYYQKYGNPNYGGMKGLISQSRKRKMMAAKNRLVVDQFIDESQGDKEINLGEASNRPIAKVNRHKSPKMKMYADEEEEKIQKSKFRHTDLRHKQKSVHSRLGPKYTKVDLVYLGSKFSSDSEEDPEDNIEINCTIPLKFNIWTDLAKSMAKEDRRDVQNKAQGPWLEDLDDLESDLDTYRKLRFKDTGDSERSKGRSRAHAKELAREDLRNTLSSSSRKSYDSRKDLRSRIKRIKKDDSESKKYRSPLLRDD